MRQPLDPPGLLLTVRCAKRRGREFLLLAVLGDERRLLGVREFLFPSMCGEQRRHLASHEFLLPAVCSDEFRRLCGRKLGSAFLLQGIPRGELLHGIMVLLLQHLEPVLDTSCLHGRAPSMNSAR